MMQVKRSGEVGPALLGGFARRFVPRYQTSECFREESVAHESRTVVVYLDYFCTARISTYIPSNISYNSSLTPTLIS